MILLTLQEAITQGNQAIYVYLDNIPSIKINEHYNGYTQLWEENGKFYIRVFDELVRTTQNDNLILLEIFEISEEEYNVLLGKYDRKLVYTNNTKEN